MDRHPCDANLLASAIRNAGYMVRHYQRPGQRRPRAECIRQMGILVKHAFNLCAEADYETLFAAIADGLRPRDDTPPF
jgi:hypothetical protein